jgi:hypothetical protein
MSIFAEIFGIVEEPMTPEQAAIHALLLEDRAPEFSGDACLDAQYIIFMAQYGTPRGAT